MRSMAHGDAGVSSRSLVEFSMMVVMVYSRGEFGWRGEISLVNVTAITVAAKIAQIVIGATLLRLAQPVQFHLG